MGHMWPAEYLGNAGNLCIQHYSPMDETQSVLRAMDQLANPRQRAKESIIHSSFCRVGLFSNSVLCTPRLTVPWSQQQRAGQSAGGYSVRGALSLSVRCNSCTESQTEFFVFCFPGILKGIILVEIGTHSLLVELWVFYWLLTLWNYESIF